MAGVPKALPQVLTSIIEDSPAPAWRDVGEKLRSSILLVNRKIDVDVSIASRLAYMIPIAKGSIPRGHSLYAMYLHLAELIETAVKAGKKDVAFSKDKYMKWLKENGRTKRGDPIAITDNTQSTTETENVAGSSETLSDEAVVEVDPHPGDVPKNSGLLDHAVAQGVAGPPELDPKGEDKEIHGDKVTTKNPEPRPPFAVAASTPRKNSASKALNVASSVPNKEKALAEQAAPAINEEAKPSAKTETTNTATKGRSLTKAKSKTTLPEPKNNKRQTAFKSQPKSSVEPAISPLRRKAIAKLGTERLLKSKDPDIVHLASNLSEVLGFMPKGSSFVKSAKWTKKIGYLHDAAVATGSSKDEHLLRNEINSFLEFIAATVRSERKEIAQSLLATFTLAGEVSDGNSASKGKSIEGSKRDPAPSEPGLETSVADPNSIQVEDMAYIPGTKSTARKRAKRLAERVGASSRPVRPTRTALRASRVVTKKASKKSRKLDADGEASQTTLDGTEQDLVTPLEHSSTVPLRNAEPPAEAVASAVASPDDAAKSDSAVSIALDQDPAQLSTPRGYEAVAKRERRIRVAMAAKRAAAAQRELDTSSRCLHRPLIICKLVSWIVNALNALGKPIDESTLHEGVPQPVLALMADAKMAAAAEEQSVRVLRQIRYAPAIKRNAVMISSERARVQEKVKADAESEIIPQQHVETMAVPDASSDAEPLLVATPPTLLEQSQSPASSLEKPVDVPPLPEPSPESAPVSPTCKPIVLLSEDNASLTWNPHSLECTEG